MTTVYSEMFNGNKGKRLFVNMKAPFMWAPFTPPESHVFYEIKTKDMQGETRINLYEGNLEVYDNGLRKMLHFFPYMKCAHVYTHV